MIRISAVLSLTAAALLASVLGGCNPSGKGPANADAQIHALLAEWMELAKNPIENLKNDRSKQIMFELLLLRPDAFTPVVELLEKPGGAPAEKVFAMESLQVVAVQEKEGLLLVPRLKPLVEPPHDATTRACALHLLAMAARPDLAPLFKANAKDPDSRIRLAALLGLVRLNDADARVEFIARLRDSATRPIEREQIVIELCSRPTEGDASVLQDAVADTKLSEDTRRIALITLGQVGAPQQLPALQQCAADTSASEEFRKIAEAAIAAIQSRAAQAQPGG